MSVRLKNDELRDFGAPSTITTSATTVSLPYGHIVGECIVMLIKLEIPGFMSGLTVMRTRNALALARLVYMHWQYWIRWRVGFGKTHIWAHSAWVTLGFTW